MDADQIEEKYGSREWKEPEPIKSPVSPEDEWKPPFGKRPPVSERKPTNPENPKDMVGVAKWRQSFCISPRVMWGVGVAMLEGALKYGRFNYRRAGVRASIYVDAAKGHIDSWIEGENIDADSRLHHLDKAIASLIVVRDSIYEGNFVDDRPMRHRGFDQQRAELQQTVDWLFERYGEDAARPITELEDGHAPEPPLLLREDDAGSGP